MWARVVEFMLACWLGLSPFIFGHPADAAMMWYSDFALAAVVATLALLSYWPPTARAHLFTLLAAAYLVGFGRFAAEAPPPPGMQNNIVVGLLLMMFAIVPNNASHPPRGWRREKSALPSQPIPDRT